ncbi:hypothetical protein [Pseudonocardia oroxyli]|uniref:Uncharacterized protein n=1 Tax=Pseudonocardia oroxyli TaxID=366584 RepID=A0A1G7TWB1_PSEOR|nr:hypothetical protein [Pseudonocardia oroxyli]SDG39553.1 hypothetical protein SAMN05216377_111158 [Pseudonocardia oroxyli]
MDAPFPATPGHRVRRLGWTLLALVLAAFTVFESVKYGLPVIAAAVAGLVVPDLPRVLGLRRLGDWAARPWGPVVLLLVGALVDGAPLVVFVVGLGWSTRIATQRVLHP